MARAKAFTFVKFTKKSCKCFSISPFGNAKAFTKSLQHLQNFVNALAFSGLAMLCLATSHWLIGRNLVISGPILYIFGSNEALMDALHLT